MTGIMLGMTNYIETPALQTLLAAADGQAPSPPPTEDFVATTLKEVALVLRALDQRIGAIERGMATHGIPSIHLTPSSPPTDSTQKGHTDGDN